MRVAPVTTAVFDFGKLGPVGIGLLLIYLAVGVFLFFLSFNTRHGRSRWPLHALMALGIVSLGTGLTWMALAAAQLVSVIFMEEEATPVVTMSLSMSFLVAPFWFGVAGVVHGVLAGIRAGVGMIREPGPRF